MSNEQTEAQTSKPSTKEIEAANLASIVISFLMAGFIALGGMVIAADSGGGFYPFLCISSGILIIIVMLICIQLSHIKHSTKIAAFPVVFSFIVLLLLFTVVPVIQNAMGFR